MELRWSELPNTILRIGIPAEIVRVKIPGLILVELMLSGTKLQKFANFLANMYVTLQIFLDRLYMTERFFTFSMPCSIYF